MQRPPTSGAAPHDDMPGTAPVHGCMRRERTFNRLGLMPIEDTYEFIFEGLDKRTAKDSYDTPRPILHEHLRTIDSIVLPAHFSPEYTQSLRERLLEFRARITPWLTGE